MKVNDRQARRMMERMGINQKEVPDVEEVVIKTPTKDLVIRGASVSEVNFQGNRIFQVDVPKVKVVDSTGAGDIFAGALISTFLRSRDFLWSCCFGIAASSLSLTSIALGKIELPRSVDQQARQLYSSAVTVGTV